MNFIWLTHYHSTLDNTNANQKTKKNDYFARSGFQLVARCCIATNT